MLSFYYWRLLRYVAAGSSDFVAVLCVLAVQPFGSDLVACFCLQLDMS